MIIFSVNLHKDIASFFFVCVLVCVHMCVCVHVYVGVYACVLVCVSVCECMNAYISVALHLITLRQGLWKVTILTRLADQQALGIRLS